jgi:hypothetical protein
MLDFSKPAAEAPYITFRTASAYDEKYGRKEPVTVLNMSGLSQTVMLSVLKPGCFKSSKKTGQNRSLKSRSLFIRN